MLFPATASSCFLKNFHPELSSIFFWGVGNSSIYQSKYKFLRYVADDLKRAEDSVKGCSRLPAKFGGFGDH